MFAGLSRWAVALSLCLRRKIQDSSKLHYLLEPYIFLLRQTLRGIQQALAACMANKGATPHPPSPPPIPTPAPPHTTHGRRGCNPTPTLPPPPLTPSMAEALSPPRAQRRGIHVPPHLPWPHLGSVEMADQKMWTWPMGRNVFPTPYCSWRGEGVSPQTPQSPSSTPLQGGLSGVLWHPGHPGKPCSGGTPLPLGALTTATSTWPDSARCSSQQASSEQPSR